MTSGPDSGPCDRAGTWSLIFCICTRSRTLLLLIHREHESVLESIVSVLQAHIVNGGELVSFVVALPDGDGSLSTDLVLRI